MPKYLVQIAVDVDLDEADHPSEWNFADLLDVDTEDVSLVGVLELADTEA